MVRQNDFTMAAPPRMSRGFELNELNYTCSSRECSVEPHAGLELLQRAYFHMIVGVDHPMTAPLLLHRICDAFQHCFGSENFRLILHRNENEIDTTAEQFKLIENIVDFLGIPYVVWTGTFSPDYKMRASYELLQNISDTKKIIYHTDIDEVPDLSLFLQALNEIAENICDAISGYWKERVARDGSLAIVSLSGSNSLDHQFPLRCKISDNVVGGGMTRKTVAYRSNFRVSGETSILNSLSIVIPLF